MIEIKLVPVKKENNSVKLLRDDESGEKHLVEVSYKDITLGELLELLDGNFSIIYEDSSVFVNEMTWQDSCLGNDMYSLGIENYTPMSFGFDYNVEEGFFNIILTDPSPSSTWLCVIDFICQLSEVLNLNIIFDNKTYSPSEFSLIDYEAYIENGIQAIINICVEEIDEDSYIELGAGFFPIKIETIKSLATVENPVEVFNNYAEKLQEHKNYMPKSYYYTYASDMATYGEKLAIYKNSRILRLDKLFLTYNSQGLPRDYMINYMFFNEGINILEYIVENEKGEEKQLGAEYYFFLNKLLSLDYEEKDEYNGYLFNNISLDFLESVDREYGEDFTIFRDKEIESKEYYDHLYMHFSTYAEKEFYTLNMPVSQCVLHMSFFLRFMIEKKHMSDEFYYYFGNLINEKNIGNLRFTNFLMSGLSGRLDPWMFNSKGKRFANGVYTFANDENKMDYFSYPQAVDDFTLDVLGEEKYNCEMFQDEAYLFIEATDEMYETMKKDYLEPAYRDFPWVAKNS